MSRLKQMTADGIKDVATAERPKGKRAIIFGVSGAYTPMCSTKHLPGYIERVDRLNAKLTDEIACVSVNDRFVKSAWAETYEATGKLLTLCDHKVKLTSALDLDLDLYGLGQRSRRYSIVIENSVAKRVHVERSIFDHEPSAAARLLAPESVV
jgi:glutaredoxin/glutathione-dependent peroxiredoxin